MSNTVGRDKLKELLSEALQESPKCHGQIMGNNPMYVMYGGDLIYVYIKNLTPAQLSNDNPDIWRAQLSSHKDFEDVLKSDYLFIFLGYDAENDVYATWNPYWTKQRLNNANNVSFYSRYSMQQEAADAQEIISLDLNNNGKVVVFPRKRLTDYLDNMSDWFDKETQYVALGSRLRVDANTAYKMLCDNHNIEPFRDYLRSGKYAPSVTEQYVSAIRTMISKGCFTRQRILFMSKDDFEGYKLVISTFLMGKEFQSEKRYILDIYKLAITAYLNFLIELRDSHKKDEEKIEEMEETEVVMEDNATEEPTSQEDEEIPLYDFDDSIDYELSYIKDQKLTRITNPKLLMQLRPVLKADVPDLFTAYGLIDEFYGDRFPHMHLSDWNSLLTTINWDDPFGRDNETDSRRKKSEILRVTLPSGEVIQNVKVVDTFVELISRLNPHKVHNLGIIHAKDNIVSRQRNQKYIVAQKDLGNGWYLLTNPTTRRKQEILRQISESLNLNWKIELVSFQTGALINNPSTTSGLKRNRRPQEPVKFLSQDKPSNLGKSWNDEDDEKLIAMMENDIPYDKIAQQLGRTEKSIYYRLEILGFVSPMEREQLCMQFEQKADLKPSTVDTRSMTIEIYRNMFLNMRRASGNNGKKAPHKVVLMLSILSVYKNKSERSIPSNIKMVDVQVSFAENWRKYVNPSDGWTPNIGTPWEHMTSEPFWHRCTDISKGCYLDQSLQYLLIDEEIRKDYRQTLKSML